MASSSNSTEVEVRVRHSCMPVRLSSINKKLTPGQRAKIQCTPFKWALEISNDFSISGGLLWELVSRWDARSRGFRVRDRIVPFTPADVCFAVGLSIVGEPLVIKEDQQCETLGLFKGADVTIQNIEKQLYVHNIRLVNFARLYILLAFVEFYFPKTGHIMFTGFIKELDDLDSLDTYNWGLAVYNFLVASLCESSRVLKEGENKAQRHLNGCAAILQIWAFNHLSLGKAPDVFELSFPRVLNWPVINMQKKNIEKAFEKNMINERLVATDEEMQHDIVNVAMFEQGHQFVDVYDHQRLIAEKKEFRERIVSLEDEVKMMKDVKVNRDGVVNVMNEDEVETCAGDVDVNNGDELGTPSNDDVDVVESQPKSASNMATRLKKQPRTRGQRSRLNL